MSGSDTIVIDTPADPSTWPEAHVGERCRCGEQAAQRFCGNGGKPENFGKEFYGCPRPRGDSCKYFMWGNRYRNTSPSRAPKRAREEPDSDASVLLSKISDDQQVLKTMILGMQTQLIDISKRIKD